MSRLVRLDALEQRLVSSSWAFLAAYLVVPTVLKAWMQPYIPIDLTALIGVPTALAGLLWVARCWRWARLPLALWGALSAQVALGVLWAPELSLAARSAGVWGVLVAVPLLAALPLAADPVQLRRFLVALLVVGASVTLIGLAVMPTVTAGELELLNANRLGIARVVLFVPLISLPMVAWHATWRVTVGVAILTAAAFLVATGTGSRGALFIAILVLMTLLVVAIVRSPHRRAVALIAVTTAVMVVVTFGTVGRFIPDHALARFGLLGELLMQPTSVTADLPTAPVSPGGEPAIEPPRSVEPAVGDEPVGGESVAVRIELARLAGNLFVARPLIGTGTGGFAAAAAAQGLEQYPHPHNLVLHVAADFGLVGLLIVGGMIAVAAQKGLRARESETVALVAVFGFLFLNAMLSNGIYENRLLWGFWLVMLAVPTIRTPGARVGRPAHEG